MIFTAHALNRRGTSRSEIFFCLTRMDDAKRPYLRIGELVTHEEHPEWGIGKVVEIVDSQIPGGICMVRIEFAYAGTKSFFNDLSMPQCCYHAGVKRMR